MNRQLKLVLTIIAILAAVIVLKPYMDLRKISFFNFAKPILTDDSKVSSGSMMSRISEVASARNIQITSDSKVKATNTKSSSFLGRINMNVSTPHTFKCMRTRTTPPFTICLRDVYYDLRVSHAILGERVYKNETTKILNRMMTAYPQASLVDIGAYIGYFSLLAAAQDRSVVAVEPAAEAIVHLRAAAYMDKRSGLIKLFKNAVTDKHTEVQMSTFLTDEAFVAPVYNTTEAKQYNITLGESVKTITLDDLAAEVKTTTVILKIDTQGGECRAFAKSQRFFASLKVPYIIMWPSARSVIPSVCGEEDVKRLREYIGGLGYTEHNVTEFRLKKRQLQPFIESVIWMRKDSKSIL